MYILHISNAYNTPAPEEAHAHICQRQMCLPKANMFTKGKCVYQRQMCLPKANVFSNTGYIGFT